MQKNLACLFAGILLSVVSLKAQISLDPSPTDISKKEIRKIELSHSGSKYLDIAQLDRGEVNILNLDGSLFRRIALPTDPKHTLDKQISEISESLFDHDPSSIEFIIRYKRSYIAEDGSQTLIHDYYVMNQNGEILFHEPMTVFIPSGPTGDLIWQQEGRQKICVMDLNPRSEDYQAVFFYSLPGTLAHTIENVSSNTAKLQIDWSHLREAPQTVAAIHLYMLDGRLAHVIQVGPADDNLKNHASQYAKGSYFYELLDREGKIIQPKRIVQIK